MSLVSWSWVFMALYTGAMLWIGYYGSRKVKNSDDFAVARGAYGPVPLAFAFAATTASGATFLGSPGLGYEWGFASQWGNFLYPIGVYTGVLICMRLIATAGNRFGNRSIPEYLGDRYQSDGIRIMVSVFSLILFFYLAGQLVSGLVMFEVMLGLSPAWALAITTTVLLFYVVMGGAHADIITDSVQGAMMLIIAVVVIILVLIGYNVEGGFSGMVDNLGAQDEDLIKPLNTATALYHSWWSIVAIVIAHVPLGLLPHLGNKLWALKGVDQQRSFIKLAAIFGLTLGFMGAGGLLARAVLGDSLLPPDGSPNQSLPLLFIEIFPTWLAALIGVGILAAIMSTADGLVVSSSQIIANDLYRRTFVPRMKQPPSEEVLERRMLTISRVSTIAVLLICTGMAWALIDINVALIVWIGNGGMMAAFAGPLVMGALWSGVTKKGAYWGLAMGFGTFLVLHMQLLNPEWFSAGGTMHGIVGWLYREGPNPYSCAAIGEIISVAATFTASKLTQPLPAAHVEDVFRPQAG